MEKNDWYRFAEKVQLALENSREADPGGGTSGLEIEFNILDPRMQPVERVGYGPAGRSFADYLHEERLPKWARDYFQLEVFHWMTELTTSPCFDARTTACQARVLEGVLLDTLADVGRNFATTFLALHGNIPQPFEVSPTSIPDGWNLARRRYLRRCVDLFGSKLATAGIHTNHSFPESLLSWDFIHLPLDERKGRTLEDYRNQEVIRSTKLLRPLCPLFIAVSAASPFSNEMVNGRSEIVLTDTDSHRLQAFPNPIELDVPGLYASHGEYLEISYGLVRSGIRFGANNWTPVRARSDVDPVRRNIMATSEQLGELYRRGIFPVGTHGSLEEAERAVVVENLCARVDLPMNRVEVRTDEGGDSLDLSTAKVLFKDLLMLRFYGDRTYGEQYAYDSEDLGRARRNELAAAESGLDAELRTGDGTSTITARELLGNVLSELDPLAEGLGVRDQLEPLREMSVGGPNPAARIRSWVLENLGNRPRKSDSGAVVVPVELIESWFETRRSAVAKEVAEIAASPGGLGPEWGKVEPLVNGLREMAEARPEMPVRISPASSKVDMTGLSDRTARVVELAANLVRIPSVTNCPDERVEEVFSCAGYIANTLSRGGLDVRFYGRGRYPAVLATFPGGGSERVMLSGHFDVVRPEPDDRQFDVRTEGEYLWGRGAADMKTVVASYMVWMAERVASGPPYPPFNLLLVGNEENGEGEPYGTPHVLDDLLRKHDWAPEFMVVGERTGEEGHETFGSVCTESRGILRMRIEAMGECGHTGVSGGPADLLDGLVEVKTVLDSVFKRHLTLSSLDGWETTARFPFLTVGEPGVYNITAGDGVLGIEIRPIPGDDLDGLIEEIAGLCAELGLESVVELTEPGVSCPTGNPHLARLLAAVEDVSGKPPVVGKKKPGSSARFAPGGHQVVWGQTGIGPHSREERHFIPSIEPYLEVLDAFADRVAEDQPERK